MAKSGPKSRRHGDSSDDVRQRLIEAAAAVAGESGFAHTSARTVASRAGVAPGVIYYHFGSMDGLLIATHDALTAQRVDRIRAAMAGPGDWVSKLTDSIKAELAHPDGGAAIELTIGAKSSPELAAAAHRNTDRAVEAVAEMAEGVFDGSPISQVIPIDAVAEVAAAAFFGAEVMTQLGRTLDVDAITAPLAALLGAFSPPSPS